MIFYIVWDAKIQFVTFLHSKINVGKVLIEKIRVILHEHVPFNLFYWVIYFIFEIINFVFKKKIIYKYHLNDLII